MSRSVLAQQVQNRCHSAQSVGREFDVTAVDRRVSELHEARYHRVYVDRIAQQIVAGCAAVVRHIASLAQEVAD